MAYNITQVLIGSLLRLSRGEKLNESECRTPIFKELLKEGLLITVSEGRGNKCFAPNIEAYLAYIATRDDAFRNLEASYEMLMGLRHSPMMDLLFGLDKPKRAKQSSNTGNSKITKTRSCTGFLVNSYENVITALRGKAFNVCPAEGTFVFIADYENFVVPQNVPIVGVENMENFRYVARQKNLFKKIFQGSLFDSMPILFVSRYPQSGDLVRWLQNNNNFYFHFGDLDLAGINIYLTEFYSKLGNRARFLVPPDVINRIENGSRERYDNQILKFENMKVADPRVQPLVNLIKKYHKCYDQEGYIE